jgi:primosomal protein N'
VAVTVADRLRSRAEAAGVEVMGPAPQALARLRGQHRWHLLLKSGSARAVRAAAAEALDALEADRQSRAVRVVADVDPVDVL